MSFQDKKGGIAMSDFFVLAAQFRANYPYVKSLTMIEKDNTVVITAITEDNEKIISDSLIGIIQKLKEDN